MGPHSIHVTRRDTPLGDTTTRGPSDQAMTQMATRQASGGRSPWNPSTSHHAAHLDSGATSHPTRSITMGTIGACAVRWLAHLRARSRGTRWITSFSHNSARHERPRRSTGVSMPSSLALILERWNTTDRPRIRSSLAPACGVATHDRRHLHRSTSDSSSHRSSPRWLRRAAC